MKENKKLSVKGGSYSVAVTIMVLAVLIVVNVLVSALPKNLTSFDISSAKLYSVTSNTKAVLNKLTDDVTIYWITQAGEEDDILDNLLNKYEALSDHIKVVKKNPDIYPQFAEQYTDEKVKNNSLVVECGERNRYISFDDIYLQEADMQSLSVNTSFDGEGAITSAIDYVTNEDQPIIYLLEGHGEKELPVSFSDQLQKANMEVKSFSLLNVDEIPEDASCVFIYAPETDLSPEEAEILKTYADDGGKLLVMAGPTPEGNLTYLNTILEDYGVFTKEGIVVEEDRMRYAFRQPYTLMADPQEHEITNPLIEERYYPIIPIASGLVVKDVPEFCEVTELLTTSETAFSKLKGYSLDTYEKEEGDIDGPFATAVNIKTAGNGQIVWFSSSNILDDMYNAYSSGANVDLALNSLSSLIGEREAVAIRSKSLNYNYLTISESTSSLLKVMMTGVFPLLYLGMGIFIVFRRKEKKHDKV